jgi:DNA-binding NarL/FixJ family response regulator
VITDRGSRVLFASNRPAIRAFFPTAEEGPVDSFSVYQTPIPSFPGPALTEGIQAASLAVVDAAPDPIGAVEFCQQLSAERPSLPIAALVCCTEHVGSWQLSALLDAGVTSLVDLRASVEDLTLAFNAIARGEVVLRFHGSTSSSSLLRIIAARQGPNRTTGDLALGDGDIKLLSLVAQGLSDHEIGGRLHISPFTVRHHIERLRREVVARNRVELAAWAGRNGFYRVSELADVSEPPRRSSRSRTSQGAQDPPASDRAS